MSAQPSKVMLARIKKLVDAKDEAGLRDLYGKLRVSTEVARLIFSRNRSVKNGDTYRRRSAELGLVHTQLRLIQDSNPKIEEDADGLLPPTFLSKVDAFYAAKDLDGLYKMLDACVLARESAYRRAKTFDSDRAKQDLSLASFEVRYLNSKIELLRKPELVTEGPLTSLQDFATNAVQTARDRVLHHVGHSGAALGRLNGGTLISQMNKDWRVYAGQQARLGNKTVGRAPTHEDLLRFLAYQYGVKLDDHYLSLILSGKMSEVPSGVAKGQQNKNAAPEATAKPQEPPKAPVASATKEGLEATSHGEYDALRKKFVKVEAINEALTDPVDLRTAIPAIANFLWMRGKLKVKRGDKTYGAEDHWDGDDSDESPEPAAPKAATQAKPKAPEPKADTPTPAGAPETTAGVKNQEPEFPPAENKGDDEVKTVQTDDGPVLQTASTRVTPDGHAIDINKMRDWMEQYGVTGSDMRHLQILIQTGGAKALAALKKSPNDAKTMVGLVGALLNSISGRNDSKNIEAQHSVTKDGHLFDINTFTKNLAEDHVTGEDIATLRSMLRRNSGQEGFMYALSQDSREAKLIFLVANAALNSITSNKKPGEKETAEEPSAEAPAQDDSLGPHRKIGQ